MSTSTQTAFPTLQEWKEQKEAPEWLTQSGYALLVGKSGSSYLLTNETPKGMYRRLAGTATRILVKMYEKVNKVDKLPSNLEGELFKMFWKGWLGGSTPVLCNFGAERALAISCYAGYTDDNIPHIINSEAQASMLSAKGGGYAEYLGAIRPEGTSIKSGGKSEGIVPWLRMLNAITQSISQNGVRRGAIAAYLDIEHKDIKTFLSMRKAGIDESRRFMSLHHAVCIPDTFMLKVKKGDKEARELLTEVVKLRIETGEPYIFFNDNVAKLRPDCYKSRGLEVHSSNICSEIVGHTSPEYTFVCCLSSLNLSKWDEWKDTNTVQLATLFLEAVMEEFIYKVSNGVPDERRAVLEEFINSLDPNDELRSEVIPILQEQAASLTEIPHFKRALAFAVKSRMLGLGAMGYHTYLQSQGIPFDSDEAVQVSNTIFSHIQKETNAASSMLANILGEPEWCKGSGFRHTHRSALAPTVSNSRICGAVSPSIEPWEAVIYKERSTTGDVITKNAEFDKLLTELGKNTHDVWESIAEHKGSVKHLDFLTQRQKDVFKTAREIDQLKIIEHAANRQQYIDQAQSLNLFYTRDTSLPNSDFNYWVKAMFKAWELGLPTLYYLRGEPESKIKASVATAVKCDLAPVLNDDGECIPCGG